jgi:hypothetical protein
MSYQSTEGATQMNMAFALLTAARIMNAIPTLPMPDYVTAIRFDDGRHKIDLAFDNVSHLETWARIFSVELNDRGPYPTSDNGTQAHRHGYFTHDEVKFEIIHINR